MFSLYKVQLKYLALLVYNRKGNFTLYSVFLILVLNFKKLNADLSGSFTLWELGAQNPLGPPLIPDLNIMYNLILNHFIRFFFQVHRTGTSNVRTSPGQTRPLRASLHRFPEHPATVSSPGILYQHSVLFQFAIYISPVSHVLVRFCCPILTVVNTSHCLVYFCDFFRFLCVRGLAIVTNIVIKGILVPRPPPKYSKPT